MTEKPAPDTVRNRKKNPAASTQRFLPIGEIRNDTVLLKNGGLRAVLRVEAMNFNLKSETEQQAIIAGYGAFMNTLTFPIQIVLRSAKTNIDEYLNSLRALGEKQENALLKEQTLGYVAFVQRLLDVAEIMQKSFYVVVPMDRVVHHKTFLEQFFSWLKPDDSLGRATARMRDIQKDLAILAERVELVGTGLTNIGLHVTRLSTRDLIALYYKVYNPRTSQHAKLPTDLAPLKLAPTTL